MSKRNDDIAVAWLILDKEDTSNSDSRKLKALTLPLAGNGDWEAATILALHFLFQGDIEECDYWTVQAGSLGARDSWISQQLEFHDFAVLAARYDAIMTLREETSTLGDAMMAFQFHLIHEISDSSFYFGVKACRAMGSEGVDKVIEYATSLIQLNFDKIDQVRNELIANCLSAAFSLEVAEAIYGKLGR